MLMEKYLAVPQLSFMIYVLGLEMEGGRDSTKSTARARVSRFGKFCQTVLDNESM